MTDDAHFDGLMVVGMGRSGTSVATRLAADLGLRLPPSADLLPANYANTTGYFESTALMLLNDRVLADLSATWWKPPSHVDLSLVSVSDEAARDAFVSIFGTESGWVFKDPRLAVLLGWWDRVVGKQPCLVPFRDPLQVAASISARDGVAPDQALAMWERHTRLMLVGISDRPVLLLDYADLLQDPAGWQRAVHDFCLEVGLPIHAPSSSATERVITPLSDTTGSMTRTQQAIADIVSELRGAHELFHFPELPPEDDRTQALIDSIVLPGSRPI